MSCIEVSYKAYRLILRAFILAPTFVALQPC